MDSLELIVTTKDGQTAACEIFYEYEGGSRGAKGPFLEPEDPDESPTVTIETVMYHCLDIKNMVDLDDLSEKVLTEIELRGQANESE